MNLQSKMPPRQREIAEGVFQSSVRFDLGQLTVEDFAAEGLDLPPGLQSAIKKRQVEYLAGRYCSQLCFEQFGLPKAPVIPSNTDRSPAWPDGWIGSIPHAHGLATAVLARSQRLRGIGVDIEHVIEKANEGLAQHICVDLTEWPELTKALSIPEDQALTLIFSSKECLYKALYPRLKTFFGFHAARVSLGAENQLRISLVTDLSDEFSRGKSWDLRYRFVENDCVETVLFDEF